MAVGRHLFTSESVTEGHPDKICDQVSDAIVDAYLRQDPQARVAAETAVTTGLVLVMGEITARCQVDIPAVVRQTVREIGYTRAKYGFDADTCAVITAINRQSPDIAQGVDRALEVRLGEEADEDALIGAGDQGMMVGFACRETPELMPLPIALAHRITNRLAEARQRGEVDWLRPDGKSQVTVEYDGQKPVRIDTVVVSTQHAPTVSQQQIREYVIDQIVKPLLPKDLVNGSITYHVNPTGRFVVGGPQGDCGLTGRKIIVDTYGGWARHGGGAFSGKDPTKVDRSAAYMARHVAKNIVAAHLADRCEVQLAYAIGVAEPVSVLVDTQGTGRLPEAEICRVVREQFPLTPGGIIKYLDLRRAIYRKTAAGGHFGRSEPEFTWESTHRAKELASLL